VRFKDAVKPDGQSQRSKQRKTGSERVKQQQKQIEALSATVQKASEKLELTKDAPQVVTTPVGAQRSVALLRACCCNEKKDVVSGRCCHLPRADPDGVVSRIYDVDLTRAVDRDASWRIKACVDSRAVRGARAES